MSGLIKPFDVTGADPYFSSVVQLARFDGVSGIAGPYPNHCPRGNTILNSTGTIFSDTQFKYGRTSLRANGLVNCAIAVSHADYNFSTNDWTVEFWLWRLTNTLDFNSLKYYYDSRPVAFTNNWYPGIASDNANGNIVLALNGAVRITGANGSLVITTWQHVAACRAAGVTRLFVDGVQVGSNFTDTNTYVQSSITLMAAGNTAAACIGYMDDLRVTNGVGRYTANFTPPTMPFPDV